MALQPLNALFGQTQGRIVPADGRTGDGDFLFVLGSDTASQIYTLDGNAEITVSQSAEVDTATMVRIWVTLRAPTVAPPAAEWRAGVLVDGTPVVERAITRDRILRDVAVPARLWGGGVADLACRLRNTVSPASTLFDADLPAFRVDAVVLDQAPAGLVVFNRDPEPSEDGIPRTSYVEAWVAWSDPAGGGDVDASTVKLWIDGVLAMDGGVAQPGFSGSQSGINLVTVQATPATPFGSDVDVVVRVYAEKQGDPTTVIDSSWIFHTVDETAPTVVGAEATAQRVIVVAFDDLMLVSGGGAADAATPSNYVLSVISGTPAVTPEIIAAEDTDRSHVRLTTSIEMTPRAVYRLTVAATVSDDNGNALGVPGLAEFSGFAPATPDGRDFSLWRMLPVLNRRDDATGDLARFVGCWQEVVDLLLAEIDRFPAILDPDFADESWLDLMLYDLGNPFPFALDASGKRRLLRVLVDIYREKGTAIGIINAVRFFVGVEVVVLVVSTDLVLGLGDWELGVDWYLGSSDPADLYSFDIVSPRALTDDERWVIRVVVDYMKVAHEHLRAIVEPAQAATYDPVELGISELGGDWILH